MTDRLIQMAVIGRAHGVRGLVRVTGFGADARALESYPLQDRQGRAVRLRWAAEGVAALAFVEAGRERPVETRTEAEALTNQPLFTPRSALPPEGEEEFYLADLIGLSAETEAGAGLGTVASVHDYGAGASLEIAGASGGAIIVPFTRAAVPTVDIAAGRVVVRQPEEVS